MDFDLSMIDERDAYKLLISVVVPRPIAFVTTVDLDGNNNAAPFSFFNVLGNEPPIVAIGIEARPNRQRKDTAENIHVTGEFVVNIVDNAIAEQMNICATDFEPEIDELAESGLTPTPSVAVAPPRIAESPVNLECRRLVTLEFGKGRQVVIGQVLHIHIRDDLMIDPARFHVDVTRLDAVGRLNAAAYARIRDRFEMPRMTVDQWRQKKRARKA